MSKANIIISEHSTPPADQLEVEIVERKGIGHPDTICDCLAEKVSRELSRYYLQEFGRILHHNVDKALLVGGQANPVFGGGEVTGPIEFFLAGRAATQFNNKEVPIRAIAEKAITSWLKRNMRYLDLARHFRSHINIRKGASELAALSGSNIIPLANDTSFGAGYYPLSVLEKLVLRAADLLNGENTKATFNFLGEDIKVMGMRSKEVITLTLAAATVSKHVSNMNDYADKLSALRIFVSEKLNTDKLKIFLNAADDLKKGNIYMTVTGTSAEQGDDGQVGRGNRANGLITPYRPMSLEAVAGKNPMNHVGKLYNIFARELSRQLVEKQLAEEAQVFVVSKIGSPINAPEVVNIKVRGASPDNPAIKRLTVSLLDEIPLYWKAIIREHIVVV